LLSVDIVAEDDSEVEECLSSQAQPARETSANAATQKKMKFFTIFILLVRTNKACAPVLVVF